MPSLPPVSTPSAPMFLGVRFEIKAISPANMQTALQVVCFFDWERNTTMTGGSGELDERLGHVLRTLRAESLFRGDELESLLIVPPRNTVGPERILLMGLGNPETLSNARLERVGRMAILEAIRLDVATFALAPDIKDASVVFPGTDAAASLVTGMLHALKTAARLNELGMAERPRLSAIALLSGHAHVAAAEEGLRVAMAQAALTWAVP